MEKRDSRFHFDIINNKLLKCKRSQANIIVTILVVLIAIVGFVLIFNIVKPLVSEKAGGISGDRYTV